MDITRGLLSAAGGAADAGADAAGDERKNSIMSMREANLARFNIVANQINTDYKHGLDAQDAEKQHGYRLDELRTREELERGRPLSEKDKAAIGLTNAQADYYRREKGKEKESSEGLKTQVDALKAIIKAGEGAPEGSPELINARNASAALGQLTGLGAGPRMDETKARAQAEKEAGSKAGLFRSDRTDFGPDGREKWINDRTQALMYGKSEGNPAPDAAPAVAGKQGGDYLGDLLNRAGVEGGKPSARQPAKTATAEPPGLLSRVPKPNVSLNNSMAGDQINQAKGLLSSTKSAVGKVADSVSGKVADRQVQLINAKIAEWQGKQAFSHADKAIAADYLKSAAARQLSNQQVQFLKSIINR